MFITFIIGTAGSGKSLLTASYSEWLKLTNHDVIKVNLDPGVIELPYVPEVDIREYVKVDSIMKQYKLGPNGAQIMAADLIADHVEDINDEIEGYSADYVLVDTPGQMELFAFRASGPYIVNELTTEMKAIIYLFDASFSANPLNYVSNLFLATAVYNRFLIQQVHVLSKIDLLPEQLVEKILDWGTETSALEDAIDDQLTGTKRILSREITQVINRLGLIFRLIPVSAKESRLIDLHGLLTRIFSGGEEVI